jgi:2'-5' RNA ligase
MDSPEAPRRGITLLARQPGRITAVIEEMLDDFRQLEPEQYFYPSSDIHVTILSIISCYSGFTLDLIDPAADQSAVRAILQTNQPFSITYSGLPASAGSGLDKLRQATRRYFRASGLQQSIDQRYSLQTAHSTVLRFRKPLQNPARLLNPLAKYQRFFVGSFEVGSVELVYND